MQTLNRARAALLCALVGLVFAWTPAAEAGAPAPAKSPQELFEQIKTCYDAKNKILDAGALCALGTQDSQALMTPMVIMISGFQAMKDKPLEKKVEAVLKEHGLDKAKMKKGPGFGAPIEKRIEHAKEMLKDVKDIPGMLRKIGKLCTASELKSKKRRPARMPLRLEDVKVSGDSATGMAVFLMPGRDGQPGKEMKDFFAAKKEGKAGWKLDFVAMEKHKAAERKKRLEGK